MCENHIKMLLAIMAVILLLQTANVLSYKRNYEAKYTKANVPLWKQRACEKAQIYKANSHYICDDQDNVKCLPGWQGDLCQVPICRKSCDPMNGYCQRPGECRCRIGYTGELCDKCIPLPGCQHGDCTKPFECICRAGWDGLFCTEPTCRQGCHNTRGYCETPGECRCRIGWAGRNCSDCSVMPGCQHGTCTKPLECQCLTGYTGLLCQTPICHADCHKQHGYCKKSGECRCKVGWTGTNCDKCFPYPGCVNGYCEKPWECNCKPGWGGILCDEELTYCQEHLSTCENKGKCVSLTKEDGSYRCHCKQGFLGKNCEIMDEFLLTSTTAPRITPPPLVYWNEEQDEDNSTALNNDIKVQSSFNLKDREMDFVNLKTNETQEKINIIDILSAANNWQMTNMTLNPKISNNVQYVPKVNSTKLWENLELNQVNLLNFTANQNFTNKTVGYINFPTVIEPTTSDIIGSSTLDMALLQTNKTKTINQNIIALNKSTASNIPITAATKATFTSSSSTAISPFSKLDDEKNLHNMPLKQTQPNKKLEADDEEDDDEECTDDNDDECEYVDEDEDDDDDDDFFPNI